MISPSESPAKEYRIPSNLSDFQRDMYIHLIDWKRCHLTEKPGHYAGQAYDAVLPEELKGQLPHLYWNITADNPAEFPRNNLLKTHGCPFMGGLNQLWRNQLLAIAIEKAEGGLYKRVFFSVVHHPRNSALAASMQAFSSLTGNSDRFFSFTSDRLVEQAKSGGSPELREWAAWYTDLYLF